MAKSDCEHLEGCRKAHRIVTGRVAEAKQLLRKLRDCGSWYPTALEIDPYREGAETGPALLKQIESIVGAKDA